MQNLLNELKELLQHDERLVANGKLLKNKIIELGLRPDSVNKPGKTTMAEAQLIGRGARYCPFQITQDESPFSRKYDDDTANELRVCEELYYHSSYNPRYIQELNTALEETGIKENQIIEQTIKPKKEFKETPYNKAGSIFPDKQKKHNREDIFSLKSTLIEQIPKVNLKTGYTQSGVAFNNNETDTI